ncbi:hypothetical protein PA598K_00373 [Paenibacillus sp. 598K]|uniref:helix-turn-helix transcriptional regulator n=1 Tax=Paenibacillus sp. 598K TaxID=1117987 RepID=UPI000FF969E6|nr:AraC family transcriptional regulator [Paenibacillus sp. 598K]GBF72137.1 hypothetical protein PA598K_00373 [Paenibacillus sp. 598K]
MKLIYDEIAERLNAEPVVLLDVHRTTLAGEGRYEGHKERPTTAPALLLALHGEAVFRFGGSPPIRLTPGCASLGGFDRTLTIDVAAGGFSYVIFHFEPVVAERLGGLHWREVAQLYSPHSVELTGLIEQLCRISPVPGQLEQLHKQTLFYQLLHEVLESARRYHNSQSSSVVEQAIAYMHARCDEALTLDALAEMFGMKPKYFSYLFHKFTGIRPIPYLIRYRMNRARELILYSELSIREIAAQVGYYDPYYFSRLFKKYMGMSPSAIRELPR